MYDEKEIKSLIQLLDDPDNNVFEAVKTKLNDLGSPIIPYLEEAWEQSFDSLFQSRIENITQNIQFYETKNKLKEWNKSGNYDLFEGALIIALCQYPEMEIDKIKNEFDKIKNSIWLEINLQLTALEKIRIINHFIYNIFNFQRSNSFYRSAQSYFINNLITLKKGSPIALAILYAALGQKLDLPIYGVALPKNFIVGYKNTNNDTFKSNVLFYINPFNKGVAFSKNEIELFIKQQKIEHKTSYVNLCSNKETIMELLKNLIDFYKKNENKIKVQEYEELLNILYF